MRAGVTRKLKTRASMVRFFSSAFLSSILFVGFAGAQQGAPAGEWPSYGGDLGHTRYSALNQINASNFSELEVAWVFDAANFGPTPE